MWLLDVNLPVDLPALLRGYGIACDTATNRGWRNLTNGALTETANAADFQASRCAGAREFRSLSDSSDDAPDLPKTDFQPPTRR